MKNIFKTISRILNHIGQFIRKNSQPMIYTILIFTASGYFVYTLGYSSNWAMIVSETRGANFYNASQQANRLMGQLGFIGVVVALLGLVFGSPKRKTYYASNIVLSLLSSILLIVSAILTLYYNKILEVMYRAITELEVPAYLYEVRRITKNYKIFDFGNIYAYFMIVVGLGFMIFLIIKLIAQKDRRLKLKQAVEAYVH